MNLLRIAVLVLIATCCVQLSLSQHVHEFTVCDTPDSATTRTFDGSCNNLENPLWGSLESSFHVEGEDLFFLDGKKAFASWPNVRTVSNLFFADTPSDKLPINTTLLERRFGAHPDPQRRNMLFVSMLQLLGHDISGNRVRFDSDLMSNFQVEILDPSDPLYQTNPPRTRLLTLASIGRTDENGVFFGVNSVSSLIDCSTVYGSDNVTAHALRTHVGGRMILTEGDNFLPPHAQTLTGSECGSFSTPSSGAGDRRADENPVLCVAHLLMVREHNTRCAEIEADAARRGVQLTDEEIYQKARKWVIAVMQHMAFNELLPLLLGPNYVNAEIGPYTGYDPTVDTTAMNVFGIGASRVVHDMVNFPLLMLDQDCTHHVSPGTLPGYPLQERANCLYEFTRQRGAAAVIRGALTQFAQDFDSAVVDSMRNVISKIDTPIGNLDVEALNIHRGRMHGVASYYILRKQYSNDDIYMKPGCSRDARTYTVPGVFANNRTADPFAAPTVYDPIECFFYVTTNETKAHLLRETYGTVEDIDAFLGMMVESTRTEGGIGATAAAIFASQMKRLRAGDRWWFENTSNGLFTEAELREIRRTTMHDLLRRNMPEMSDLTRLYTGRNPFVIHPAIHPNHAPSFFCS